AAAETSRNEMALRGAASRRYAESVFAIAKDGNNFDRWLEDVHTLASVFTDAGMKRFLDDPKTKPPEKEATLRKVLEGKVDPLAANLAILLLRRDHTGIAESLDREL